MLAQLLVDTPVLLLVDPTASGCADAHAGQVEEGTGRFGHVSRRHFMLGMVAGQHPESKLFEN